MKKNPFWLLALPFFLLACRPDTARQEQASPQTETAPQPSEAEMAQSLFQLPDTFLTQDGRPMTLAGFKGRPTIISMVFTYCGYACPRLTADMQQIEQQMGAQADKVNFVLVSFDVARDSPARLKQYAAEQQLSRNFTLLHGSEEAVRNLGVLLDIQFEKDEDGNFAHGNIITVLDPNGIIRHRKEGLEQDHAQTIREAEKYL